MTGHQAPIDARIGRMRAPTAVIQALIEADRRALRIAQVEVEDRDAELAREKLDLVHDAVAEPVPARPGCHKGAGQGAGKGLRLVVARRAAELRRAGDD